MTNKPSRRALETAFPGHGKALRELLTSVDEVRRHPAAIRLEQACYTPCQISRLRLEAINAELETYGVEYIAAGANANSLAIAYCNAGDTYATTILRVNGRYRIGDWGSIVERGDYA